MVATNYRMKERLGRREGEEVKREEGRNEEEIGTVTLVGEQEVVITMTQEKMGGGEGAVDV